MVGIWDSWMFPISENIPFGFLTTVMRNWEEGKVKRIQKYFYLDRDISKTGLE